MEICCVLTGIWVGCIFTFPLPVGFPSERVIVVTLTFAEIKQLFTREKRVKFLTLNKPQSPDIGQNSDGGTCDFHISSQSHINENCHICTTFNDIDMKLGPVTKLDKRNTATPKKSIMTYRQIVTSLSFFRFMANLEQSRVTDSGRIVCSTYISIRSNLLWYKK